MHRQQLTDQELKFISQEFEKDQICESMNLSSKKITADGVKYLADMVEGSKTLKYLWLAANQIGDRGTLILCSAFHTHGNLHSLDLASNGITDQSVEAIPEMIKGNSSLKLFFYRYQSNIREK